MLIAIALVVFIGGASLAQAGGSENDKPTAQAKKLKSERCPDVGAGIQFYRQSTWKWQTLMDTVKTKASKQRIPASACAYARHVAKLWQHRSMNARLKYQRWAKEHVIPPTWDWLSAVNLVQRIYPGTKDWLLFISHREGGWGRFVMNSQGSGAGGWMQFMSSTYYAYNDRAFADARSRGFHLDSSVNSWQHPMGQAVTAGYMRYVGLDGCHWCL